MKALQDRHNDFLLGLQGYAQMSDDPDNCARSSWMISLHKLKCFARRSRKKTKHEKTAGGGILRQMKPGSKQTPTRGHGTTASQETTSQPNGKTATKVAKEAKVENLAKVAKGANLATDAPNGARKKAAPRTPQETVTSAPHAGGRGWKMARLRCSTVNSSR